MTEKKALSYTFNVTWSDEDDEWVGTCPAFPSLSFLTGDSRAFALLGIAELVYDSVWAGEYGVETTPDGFTVDDLRTDLEDLKVTPVRAQVLREAESLVCGDREEQYGNPRDNLKRIAEYWNDYLYPIMQSGDLLEPRDVALMMILAKVAREAAGHKRYSCVDIAGYAAIAAEVA